MTRLLFLFSCFQFVGCLPIAEWWRSSTLTAAERPNVVFILSDDHRYDFMSCVEGCPKFLTTPNLDRLAAEGALFKNAFVTTSLCSPSRASILTGQYMHHHRVVDNQREVPEGTQFFPMLLQTQGYRTGFIGKWHMGHDVDDPRPGFDHWVSFAGQGEYFNPLLNTNGQRAEHQGYTTDVLTDQALQWLAQQQASDQPFFLYLSYKAVHYPFTPAPRNAGKYRDQPIDYPETMANTDRNYETQPRWVLDRRYSIHGIDHMQTGAFDKDPVPDFDALYRGYAETVFGLDENIGRVLDFLDTPELKDTIVIYMGDNGFELGEHGFYDKRDAFEHSIRVPMLARAPGRIRPGTEVEALVQNIDIAPTVLDLCGVKTLPQSAKLDGQSLQPLWTATDSTAPAWRDHILYEYHWEWNFPATPTTLAIRTDRFKYIYYHGVWDHNGFYDLQTDPHERHNLINVPAYQDQIAKLQQQLFDELQASGGLTLPIRPPVGERLDQRKRSYR